jgi:hypothetical protein
VTRIFIVVPTRNSAPFLGHTLASLLEAQPGDFHLHVHVQDGLSDDGTLEVVRAWQRRVASGEVPDAARRVLSVATARDSGLYDAVATAFDALAAADEDVTTWLGSDDLLMPGALATAANVFEKFPAVRWISGQPLVIDEKGAWYGIDGLQTYAQRDLRRGLHDGRALRFVQHEGTFWRAGLYREAGGLRRDLRLAGDFDLWRRFARTAALAVCPFPLGAWRQRPGQTSADLAAYYREVDRSVAEAGCRGVDEEAAQDDPAVRFRPTVVERHFGSDYALREDGLPFHALEGFGPVEPASPGEGRHAASVRMAGARALLRVPLLEAGVPYRFALRVRSAGPHLRLTVEAGAQVVHDAPLRGSGEGPELVTFTLAPAVKWPVLTLRVGPAASGPLARLARGVRGRGASADRLLVEDLAFDRRPS